MTNVDLNNANNVRKAFREASNLESIKYLYENAREHIDADTIQDVFVFAGSFNLEISKFLFENAREHIDAYAINYVFKHQSSDIEILKFLLKNAKEHIDGDTINYVFKHQSSDLEILKFLLKNAKEHIDADTIKDVFVFAGSFNLEISKFLFENAREHIDADTINYVFTWQYVNLEILKFLFENAREHIDAESVKYVFKHSSSDIEKLKFLFESAREHIDAESVKYVFKHSSSDIEKLKFLFESAREHIDAGAINYVFEGRYNNLEILKFLLENAREHIDAEVVRGYFVRYSYDPKILELLLENTSPDIDEKIIAPNNFLIEYWHSNQDKYPNINLEVLAEEISKIVFSETMDYNSESWRIINENHLYQKPQDLVLIGFNNHRGEWSEGLLELLDNKNKMNYKVYRLKIQDIKNEHFLYLFDAFINPGAIDSFPEDGLEFSLSYLDNGHGNNMEYSYQRVIDFAKKNNKPYLGICNGAQHLILNEGGYVHKVPDHNKGISHDFVAKSGSIIEFLAMNKEEQSAALFSSYFPSEIKFSINTQHNYAGVLGKTGNVELGGVSEENVVEAIARNFYQIGYQFHPENKYHMPEDMVFNRNENLLFNFIKIINLSKNVDINDFSDKLQEMLTHAHQNARCSLDEDVCHNPAIIVDFFNVSNEELDLLGSFKFVFA